MMRALAEFIMRGRWQAALVAVLGSLVPLISPAAVGLVTLRRNYQDGFLVLLWAAIPVLATLYLGADSGGYLVVLTSLTILFAVIVGAEVLKGTVSWQITLLVILGLCSLLVVSFGSLMQGEADQVLEEVQVVIGNLDAIKDQPVSSLYLSMAVTAVVLSVEKVTTGFLLGFLSTLTAVHVICSLLLSRWWQALLYNPGGFRSEFHSLRFTPVVASILLLAVVALNFQPPSLAPWAVMTGFPLLLAGVGMVHHAVATMGMGTMWLVMFYCCSPRR